MTSERFRNKRYEIDGLSVSKEEAILQKNYSIVYYDEFENIYKIEVLVDNQINKVVYPDRELPVDDIVEAHFANYNEQVAEILTKKQVNDVGEYVYISYLYKNRFNKWLILERYENEKGDIIKEVQLGEDNKPLGISIYEYAENGELLRIIEKNNEGNTVGGVDFSIVQKF